MSRIAVRWMGAFGHYGTLSDSLRWEFNNTREVAAEWYHGIEEAAQSSIYSQVGLLVNRGAIIRAYDGDVWSVNPDGSQRLIPTRASIASTAHTECFCRPEYRGIVIRRALDSFRPEIRRAIRSIAIEHKLPIYWVRQDGTVRRFNIRTEN